MRIAVKYTACLLVLAPLLQGCDQKNKALQNVPLAPPIVDTPPEKPASVSTADLPPPVVGNAQPVTPPPDTTAEKPPEPVKKPVRHPKRPATQPSQDQTQETAKVTPPSAPANSSPIGQLSGGASGDQRSQTEDTINSVEKGVNGIGRSLSDAETKIVSQIREFLKQARQALSTGDTDGARNLASKAKVLLSELNQQ